jgi:fibronectin-binding autotransporter adhesin
LCAGFETSLLENIMSFSHLRRYVDSFFARPAKRRAKIRSANLLVELLEQRETPTAYTWTPTAAGAFDWNSAANWTPSGFPNAAGDVANIASALAGDETINIKVPITVGAINIGASSGTHTFTVAAATGGTLMMADPAGPVINKTSGGADQITADFAMGNDLSISNTATTSLTLGGKITNDVHNLTVSGTGDVDFGGVLSGAVTAGGTPGLVTLNGPGNVNCTAANSFTGASGINVSAGTLTIASLALPPTNIMTISSGAFVNSTGTLYVNVSGNGGAASTQVTGSGTLRLTSTNNNGTTAPDIWFGKDHQSNSWYGSVIAANIDLGSVQRYIFSDGGHNSVSNYYGTGNDSAISGNISGTGGITYIAQDAEFSPQMEVNLVLSGTNTFSGPLEIDRGSIYLITPQAFPGGNKLIFNTSNGHNAKLFLLGNSITASNLTSEGDGTGNQVIANGNVVNNSGLPSIVGGVIPAATLTVNETAPTTFSGLLTDTQAEYDNGNGKPAQGLSLSEMGTATLTLTGANTYTGVTTINGEATSVATITNGGTTSPLGAATSDPANLVLDGGTLQYTGKGSSTDRRFTVTSNGGTLDASGTGPVSFTGAPALSGTGASQLTLTGTSTAANTLSAPIADGTGATSLIKSGIGTWDLTGANTYTGPTSVNAGTLLVDGSLTSPVTVAAGATLAGNGGTLKGSVSVGGTLTSGNATTPIAPLTVGNLSFTGAGKLAVTLDGTSAGTGYDQITGSGTITLTGAALNVSIGPGFYPPSGTAFDILVNKGGAAITGTFTGLAEGATVNAGSQEYTISYTGGTSGHDVVLTRVVHNIVYVDTAWAALASGAAIADADPVASGAQPAVVGTTAFASVNAAIAADPALGTVIVNGSYTGGGSGIFHEDVNVNKGLTLFLQAGPITFDSLASGADAAVILSVDTASKPIVLTTGGDNASTTILGTIGGSGGLTKTGTGTLTLSGSDVYAGPTTISGGNLQAGSSTALSPNSAFSVAAGSTLALNGNNSSLSSLAGAGTLQNASATPATLTVATTATPTTVSLQLADGTGGGALSLAVTGTGTLILSNDANSYTGSTNVGAATLSFGTVANGGSPSSIGAATADPANLILEGGKLVYTGATGSTDRGFTLGSGGGTVTNSTAGTTLSFGGTILNGANNLTLGGAGNLAFGGVLNGTTGTVTQAGPGTSTFTNPNAFGTPTTGSPSTGGTYGSITTGDVTVTGGNLTVNYLRLNEGRAGNTRDASIAAGAFLTITGTIAFDPNQNIYTPMLTGPGTLQLRNPSASATNPSLADDTGPNGGDGGPWGTAITARVDVGTGPTQWIVGATDRNDISRYAGDFRLDAPLSGSAGLQVVGINVNGNRNFHLVLNADNSGTGGATPFTGPVFIANCDLDLTNNNALTSASSVTFDSKLDPNTQNVGALYLYGHSVSIGSINDISAPGTVAFIRNGALDLPNGGTNTGHGGNGAPGGIALGIQADSILTINQTTDGVFNGKITDGPNDNDLNGDTGTYRTLSIVKTGPGTLSLAASANQHLNITGAPTGGTFTLSLGGVTTTPIAYNAAPADIQAAVAKLPLPQGGTIGAANVTVTSVPGTAGAFIISFGGTYTSTGFPLLTADGSNLTGGNSPNAAVTVADSTYTGSTTISGGVLSASSITVGGVSVTNGVGDTPSSIGSSSNAATSLVLDGGTLRYTGPATSTDRLFTVTGNGGTLDASGSGALVFTAGNIVFSGSGATTLTLTGTSTAGNSLGETIADGTGPTSVVKTGSGTWDLAGTTNSYTGPTKVNGGTLLVDGTITSGVTVAAGATLSGSGGTISAPVAVGGTLSAGNAAAPTGLLSVGNLSFTSGGVFAPVLAGTTPGTNFSQVTGTGSINLNNAALNVVIASGFTPAVGSTYDILASGGASISGTFNNLAEGATVSAGGNSFKISYVGGSGHDVVLTAVTPVPTPPSFTSAPSTTFTVGVNGSFNVTANGVPSPTISESGTLPTGVTFTAGVLGGMPAAGQGGTYNITFTATNASGTQTQNFTLSVNGPPNITSADSDSFALGTNGSFTVTTTGTPTAVLTETGSLPNNVTFKDNHDGTATIAGTPAAGTAGPYVITISADNGISPKATQTFTLTVTSATLATNHFKVVAPATADGAPVNFTVTALDQNNNPTGSGYTGTVHFTSTDGAASLPADATLTNGTGVFSATLNTAGVQVISATDAASPGITGTSGFITVSATATQLAVAGPGSAVAGTPFLITVTAQDSNHNTATGYTGTVHLTSTDTHAVLPADATLTNGVGTFLVTLKTVTGSPWTISATDTAHASITGVSGSITVAPGSATLFTVVAPSTATTGIPVSATITAMDSYGNVATGYTGKVHFTSSDAAAVLPADAGLTNGVGTFNVTLKTAGNQTITATDNAGTVPIITGTSSAIATRGLVVTGLTSTANGFTVNFSEPFAVGDVNLYGGSQTSPLQDVTLVGTSSGPVNGSFVVDPSGTIATFKASSIFLSTFLQSSVLPNDTWTVTLVSGTGTGATAHGFFDSSNVPLDGAGNAGHDNYTTTFTTANGSKEALSIPDFARGPDGANSIKVPNESVNGIPVTLANVPAASGATDVVFTLTYNPTLLTPTGAGTGDSSGTGSTFTMGTPVSVDAAHSTVTFTWHNGTAQSGTVVLGDILANVPNSAANEYKGKEILGLSQIKVNNADFTGVWADGLHVNAYFGDVTGDGKITGLDVATAGAVAGGSSLGLSAFKLVDPAVVGDIAGDASIDATAVSDLAAFTSSLPTPQIPAIPSGLTITPGGPDPTLSLGEVGRISNPSYGEVVSVLLDHPHPVGSTGMEEAVLALTYDPKVLTVSSSDITLGSIPGLAGWHLVSMVDQATGQIGIDLYSTTAITATQAGSLVDIAFHVVPGATVPATAVQLASAVTPNGRFFSTEVADDQGQYVLSPGIDRLTVETNVGPVSAATPVSMGNVVPASVLHGQPESMAVSVPDESAGSTSLLLGAEATDGLAVMSNGSVTGEAAALHTIPANLVVTGALAFQSAVTPVSQVLQAASLTAVNPLSGLAPHQLVDRLFLAMARNEDAPAQDSEWTSVSLNQDWLSSPAQATAARPEQTLDAPADQNVVIDEVFAQMADEGWLTD